MTMMIPVRCFTCGAVVGQHWDEYRKRQPGRGRWPGPGCAGPRAVLLHRMLLTHVDLLDEVGPYG